MFKNFFVLVSIFFVSIEAERDLDEEYDLHSACKLRCDRTGVVYGSRVTCSVVACEDKLRKSIKWLVESRETRFTTSKGSDNSVIISTEPDHEVAWGYKFANRKVDYNSNEYKHITVATDPQVLNIVDLSIATSVIDSLKPAGHEVFQTKYSGVDEEDENNDTIAKAHFIETARKVYPFKTWWGTDGANSLIGRTVKKALNVGTLGLFDIFKLNKNYSPKQMVFKISPFAGKQKVIYSVAHSNKRKKLTFKVKAYLDRACNTDMEGDGFEPESIRKGKESEVMCESEDGENCAGIVEFDNDVVCFVITCNDNLHLQRLNGGKERKVCELDYSVQFVNDPIIPRSEVMAKLKDLKIKYPLLYYYIGAGLLTLGAFFFFVIFTIAKSS